MNFLANYTIVPPGRLVVNHITTIDDTRRFVAMRPADDELAYTTYVSHPLVIVPVDAASQLLSDAQHATDVATLCRVVGLAASHPIDTGSPVAVVEVDTTTHHATRLL